MASYINKMNQHWYELEIQPLVQEATNYYPIALYNRSDENAGFDLFSVLNVHVAQAHSRSAFSAARSGGASLAGGGGLGAQAVAGAGVPAPCRLAVTHSLSLAMCRSSQQCAVE